MRRDVSRPRYGLSQMCAYACFLRAFRGVTLSSHLLPQAAPALKALRCFTVLLTCPPLVKYPPPSACPILLHFQTTGTVLVHCAAGISRSASVVVAFLMWRQGLSYEAALARVRDKRPFVLPNRGFRLQVRTSAPPPTPHPPLLRTAA